ncbi:MAG: 5-methylcytosine-specific restriction enzyme B [Syntrophus sp. PtaU1.Bin005]|nr:MAG: 5-methylcytosine-specific restriction enzyme B [Syntrophus sp. PtaU1.Bin005]
MARYSDFDTGSIYKISEVWKQNCLINDESALWPGSKVWSLDTLNRFKKCFIDNPDESEDSFEEKFKRQLATGDQETTKLACDILLVYFLFTSGVGQARKEGLIKEVASWKGLAVDFEKLPKGCLAKGIGNPGLAYNTRRPFEIGFIAEFAIKLKNNPPETRKIILSNQIQFRELLDDVMGESRYQSRDIILHLLFPDQYERIASRNHKELISETFYEILKDPPEDIDDRLYAIRIKLESLLPNKHLDFYWPPLFECWYEYDETEALSPIQALGIKRQIVFFGPPGTGKTHEAKDLSKRFIRQSILRKWGPNKYFNNNQNVEALADSRIVRIQFHPGYGYEDLIRGLQIGDGGKTEYRNGILLNIINSLNKEPTDYSDLPFVVILDEMNRADLSKVLGECFSLLEDRGTSIQLAGQDKVPQEIKLPQNLYFIGTMNLIDQSLEQIDFALRRRFLWFFRGFSPDDFIKVSEYRWINLFKEKTISKPWEKFKDEFDMLSVRAEKLNALIAKENYLGPQYQIGHTYFCDVVYFSQRSLSAKSGQSRLLFNAKGHAREPISALWKYALSPLIEQYLSGAEQTDRQNFMNRARNVLINGTD